MHKDKHSSFHVTGLVSGSMMSLFVLRQLLSVCVDHTFADCAAQEQNSQSLWSLFKASRNSPECA